MKLPKNIKTEYIIGLFLVGFLLIHFAKYMSTESFINSDVSHGDIKFYGRDSCPFCVKMKNELKTDMNLYKKIEYIDIETENGANKFKEISASGVPHFECQSTGKSSSGFQPVNKLLHNLGLSK